MANSKVIVAGSINMDIVAFTQKHPRTGETVFGSDLKYFPGGKGANQAVASAKLGVKTVMVGMVGKDNFGDDLINFIVEQGVENWISAKEGVPTGTALITVSSETSDNTIVVIPGANFELAKRDISDVEVTKGDVLVCQFEIPIETVEAFFIKGRKAKTINILNPAPARPISKALLELTDVLVLNETELELITKSLVDISDVNSIEKAVKKIRMTDQVIIVTLGEKGVIAFVKDDIVRVKARRVKAVDTTGAGDCFVGAFAAKLSAKASIIEAIKFANTAASICVTKRGAGTSMPTIEDVNEIFQVLETH